MLFGWRDKTSSFLSSGAREWWGGGWTREDHVLWMEVEYRSAGGDVCNESLDVITPCVIRAFTAMCVHLQFWPEVYFTQEHCDFSGILSCSSSALRWVLMTSVIKTALKCRIQTIRLPAAFISHQISRGTVSNRIKYRPTQFFTTFSADCGRQYALFNTF